MVTTTSPKKAKPSYAERVLGAFSHLQTEHRKHAVHLASLRAQVRKNAQERKDKLGPNWSQWVSKAVAKLEEEGFFEPAPTVGCVALTQKGKKTISNARKSLRLSIGGSPNKEQELSIWREVTSHGVKRSRRASTFQGSAAGDSPTKSGSARKRARVSFGGGMKPVSRMTKAELKTELATLQQAHVLLRDASPLTDLDDEDAVITTQLREELKERDEELEGLRRQLALARRHSETESISTGRFATPENFARPVTPPRQANVVASRRYPGGVVRTESGSFIPVVSKQPTPAPSSPERDMNYDERDADLRDFEMGGSEQNSLNVTKLILNAPGLTTNAVRQRSESEDPRNALSQPDTIIASLKVEIQTLQTQVLKSEALIAGKTGEVTVLEEMVQSLEVRVQEREATIDTLLTEVAGVRESWRQVEEGVTARDAELRVARSVADGLRAEGEGLKTRVGVLESENARLESDLQQSQTELTDVRCEKDDLKDRHAAALDEATSLKQSEEERKARISSLVESLAMTANDAQILREQSATLEASVSKYKSELHRQQVACDELTRRLQDRDTEVERLSGKLGDTELSVEAISGKLVDAEALAASLSRGLSLAKTTTESARAALTDTAARLALEEVERRRAEEGLAAKTAEILRAEQVAESLRSTVDELTGGLRAREDAANKLQEGLNATRRRLTTAEKSLVDTETRHRAEREALSAEISDRQTSLESASNRIDGLSAQLQAANSDKKALEMDLATKNMDIASAKAELRVEHEQRTALEADLGVRVARIHNLEEELSAFKRSKEADQRTIATLKASFMKLRESQREMFGELEKTITSAQSSPAPNGKPWLAREINDAPAPTTPGIPRL